MWFSKNQVEESLLQGSLWEIGFNRKTVRKTLRSKGYEDLRTWQFRPPKRPVHK